MFHSQEEDEEELRFVSKWTKNTFDADYANSRLPSDLDGPVLAPKEPCIKEGGRSKRERREEKQKKSKTSQQL